MKLIMKSNLVYRELKLVFLSDLVSDVYININYLQK